VDGFEGKDCVLRNQRFMIGLCIGVAAFSRRSARSRLWRKPNGDSSAATRAHACSPGNTRPWERRLFFPTGSDRRHSCVHAISAALPALLVVGTVWTGCMRAPQIPETTITILTGQEGGVFHRIGTALADG
jgi:hypothetical protein